MNSRGKDGYHAQIGCRPNLLKYFHFAVLRCLFLWSFFFTNCVGILICSFRKELVLRWNYHWKQLSLNLPSCCHLPKYALPFLLLLVQLLIALVCQCFPHFIGWRDPCSYFYLIAINFFHYLRRSKALYRFSNCSPDFSLCLQIKAKSSLSGCQRLFHLIIFSRLHKVDLVSRIFDSFSSISFSSPFSFSLTWFPYFEEFVNALTFFHNDAKKRLQINTSPPLPTSRDITGFSFSFASRHLLDSPLLFPFLSFISQTSSLRDYGLSAPVEMLIYLSLSLQRYHPLLLLLTLCFASRFSTPFHLSLSLTS